MSNTSAFLRSVFRETLAIGIGAPALLASCGEPGIEDDAGFVDVCQDDRLQLLPGIVPAEPVDYLVWLRNTINMEEVGTPCAGATDPAVCLAELNRPSTSPPELVLGETTTLLLDDELRATRGDQVIRIASSEELRVFLGPIDTPADAILRAVSGGFTPTCGRSGAVPQSGGYAVQLFTYPGCDGRMRHLFRVSHQGTVEEVDSVTEVEADPGCVVGRRPAGLCRTARRGRQTLASHFARSAELEAASVHAFERLELELEAFGAPLGLRAQARRAAREEVRHALDVARLARRFGGQPARPRIAAAGGARAFDEVVLENAVEGCVRETYGVLVALHQAKAAKDAGIRRTYRAIAADETRHAALSWDIARWAAERLSPAQRRRTSHAVRQAIATLRAAEARFLPDELTTTAGLPPRGTSRAMIDHLDTTLWRTLAV
jgi:hypothetical protein